MAEQASQPSQLFRTISYSESADGCLVVAVIDAVPSEHEESILQLPTYLAWGVMAATLCAAGVWYWKTGYRGPQRSRRGVGLFVGVIFAINGFINSVWLGVYREGSLEAALSPLGLATAIVTSLLMFGLSLLMTWPGARVLRRAKERQAKQS